MLIPTEDMQQQTMYVKKRIWLRKFFLESILENPIDRPISIVMEMMYTKWFLWFS